MNLIRLTGNRIIDMSRFVALIPSNNNNNYLLILEGSAEGILIQDNELEILTKYLGEETKLFATPQTEDSLEDLAKPQAVEILKARIARHEPMSDTEAAQKTEVWERFKQNIDADRPDGCKLYS
jgi:hypothetical protein